MEKDNAWKVSANAIKDLQASIALNKLAQEIALIMENVLMVFVTANPDLLVLPVLRKIA